MRSDCVGEDEGSTRNYLTKIRLSVDRIESLVNYKVLNSSKDILPIDLTNVFVGQIDMTLEKTQRLYQYLQLNRLRAEVYSEDAVFIPEQRTANFLQMSQQAFYYNTMNPNLNTPLARIIMRRSEMKTTNNYRH